MPKHPNNRKVPNQAPIAVLSIESISGLAVTVRTTGTVDGDGTIAAGQVDWGDGGAATSFSGAPASTYSHTYAADGTYEIVLSVVDNKFAGDAASSSVTLDVPDPTDTPPSPEPDDPPTVEDPPTDINLPPVAFLIYVSGQYRGDPYTLSTAGTLDPDSGLVSGTLTWGDGTSPDSWSGQPASSYAHTYANAGTYVATLTVVDAGGLTATATRQVVIESPVVVNQPPIANITFVSGSYAGSTTTVSTAGTSDPENAIASGTIAWGDGTTTSIAGSPDPTYRHTYGSAGAYTVTFSVTDSGGRTAQDTLALTINAAPPAASGNAHDYFNNLIERGDFWRGLSFRPVPGTTDNQSPYWEKQLFEDNDGGFQADTVNGNDPAISYSPNTDTDPNKQDAAKVVINPYNRTAITLSAAISATDTTIPVNNFVSLSSHRQIRIDSEAMQIVSGSGSSYTVQRGIFGTTATSHASGTTVYAGTNSIRTNLQWPMDETHTNGGTSPLSAEDKLTKFLITWDCLWTDSYVNTGLTNHKSFQVVETGSGGIWLEPNAGFSGGVSAVRGSFTKGSDVGAVYTRAYASQVGSTVTDIEPLQPQANTFTIRPNTWVRYWYLVEVIDITSAFQASGAVLAASIDNSQTTITVDIAGVDVNGTGSLTKGHYLKIDSEIFVISSTGVLSSGTVRSVGVTRAQKSTSAASHTVGASVSVCPSMHVSAWVADESRAAVQLYNQLALAPRPSTANENALNDFVVEFNTSTETLATRYDRDLVAYVRNLCVLKSDTVDPSGDGLLVQPVR